MLKDALVRVSRTPQGDLSWSEEMRSALVGVMFKAYDHPECFQVPTQDFLRAVRAQCVPGIADYWQIALGDKNDYLWFGKGEATALPSRFKIQIVAPLEEEPADRTIRSAWVGLVLEIGASSFTEVKYGYYISRISATAALQDHNSMAAEFYEGMFVNGLIGTMFVPLSACKLVTE